MEIISLITGISALLFTIAVYIVHDRKLKQQQSILNDYQLKIISEQKKAEVRALIVNRRQDSSSNWTATLVVKNYGKATAYNVRLEEGYLNRNHNIGYKSYSQLLPEEAQESPLGWLWHMGGETSVTIAWDDESGNNRQYKCTLNL